MRAMRRAASHGARLAARGLAAQGQQGRGLHAVAKAELEGEQLFLKDLLRPDAPPGWAVECPAGAGYFRMKKKAGGLEVVIDCEFVAHDPAADTTEFTAFITKDGVTGDFTLKYVAVDGSIHLEAMAMYESQAAAFGLRPEDENERDQHYVGPSVRELETTLVPKEVKGFLSVHGINSGLCDYMHKQVQIFEQEAYMAVLEDLATLTAPDPADSPAGDEKQAAGEEQKVKNS